MSDMREAKRRADIARVYDKLHENKIGAHWLWCVIEQIANGVPEAEALNDYRHCFPRKPREGFVEVPVEPTTEMIKAAGSAWVDQWRIYRAMLAALPKGEGHD